MHGETQVSQLRLGWFRYRGDCSVGAEWNSEELSDADVSYLLGELCAALGGVFVRVDGQLTVAGNTSIYGYCEEKAV